jgi:hypothetical protein
MDCDEKSSRAKRLAHEVNLILQWDFQHPADTGMEHEVIGQQARKIRRMEIFQELALLRRGCAENYAACNLGSECGVKAFFGMSPSSADHKALRLRRG